MLGTLLGCAAAVVVVVGLAARRLVGKARSVELERVEKFRQLEDRIAARQSADASAGAALQQEHDRVNHEGDRVNHEGDRVNHEDPPLQQEDPGVCRWGSRRQEISPDPAQPPGASADASADPSQIRNPIEPKILLVGVDGGGTEFGTVAPVAGWPPPTSELLRSRRRTIATIAEVEVRVRPIAGGVHLHAPGLVLLAIHPDHARLVMPAAALDLQGDVEHWLDRWVPWATRALGLEASAAQWESQGIDAHIDAAGIDMPDAWVIHPDAWSGRSARRTPRPDGVDQDGRLLGFRIGAKTDGADGRACDTSLYGYRKRAQLDAQQDRAGHRALGASHEAALRLAYPHLEDVSNIDVWRFEAHLRGRALDLRSDDGEGEWCLRDPRALTDPRAIAAALAYVFGTPETRNTGVIRLTDEGQRDTPAKDRDPHPIWTLLREAAAAGPKGRIVQAREARRLELGHAQERAARRASRALGQLAGAAGEASTPTAAAEYAAAIVPQICKREDWAAHVSEGRVAHAVLHEPQP